MSDEESFVVLGSTPTPSMELYNGSGGSFVSQPKPASIQKNVNQILGTSMSSSTATLNNYSLLKRSELVDASQPTALAPSSIKDINTITNSVNFGTACLEQSGVFPNPHLAVSLILGKVDADTLKASMSLGNSVTEVDATKLEKLINDHNKVKENLQKTNVAMHSHLETMKNLQKKLKEVQDAKNIEIDLLKNQQLQLDTQNKEYLANILEKDEQLKEIDILKTRLLEMEHQNKEYLTNLLEKDEQLKANVACMKEENAELVKDISNKEAIIRNQAAKINAFDDSTFEILGSKSSITEESLSLKADFERELKTQKEDNKSLVEKTIRVEKLLKECEKKINELNVENTKLSQQMRELTTANEQGTQFKEKIAEVERANALYETRITELVDKIDDMEQLKLMDKDRIENLQGKLEELEKSAAARQSNDVDSYKSKIKELESQIAAIGQLTKVKELEDQIEALKTQSLIWEEDFQAERASRQEIASQKDVLYNELIALQRTNEKLIRSSPSRGNFACASPARQTGSSPANSASAQRTSPPHASTGAYKKEISPQADTNQTACPVCFTKYRDLRALELHVQDCLDGKLFTSAN